MSAFMIGFSTMDAVLTFASRMNYLAMTPEQLTRQGRALLELNALAVEGRYEHNKGVKDFDDWFLSNAEIAGDYVFTPRTESDVILYKSLSCWLYQCAENPAIETRTFKAWDDFSERFEALASDPGWDTAPWGLCIFGQDEFWTEAGQQAKWAEMRASVQ